MTDLETKRRQFNDRLEQIRREQEGRQSREDAAASQASIELERRLDELERRMEQRLEEHRQYLQRAVEQMARPAAPTWHTRVVSDGDADLQDWIEELDAMMLDELQLRRLPQPVGFQKITVTSGPPVQQQALPRSAEGGVSHRGVWHIPGQGTLIDLDHYRQRFQLQDLRRVGRKQRAEFLQEMVGERWGWGYLCECTTLGQQAGKLGLWPALDAARLGLVAPDLAANSLAQALHQSWLFTAAGWQDWVEQYALYKARSPLSDEPYRPVGIRILLNLLRSIALVFPLPDEIPLMPDLGIDVFDLLGLVLALVRSALESPEALNPLMTFTQHLAPQIDAASQGKGLPSFTRLVGQMYFNSLESRVGTLCSPFAMQIICHDQYKSLQEGQTAGAFSNIIHANPRANPDIRLALFSRIDQRVKYDPQSMCTAAWETLNLSAPANIFA